MGNYLGCVSSSDGLEYDRSRVTKDKAVVHLLSLLNNNNDTSDDVKIQMLHTLGDILREKGSDTGTWSDWDTDTWSDWDTGTRSDWDMGAGSDWDMGAESCPGEIILHKFLRRLTIRDCQKPAYEERVVRDWDRVFSKMTHDEYKSFDPCQKENTQLALLDRVQRRIEGGDCL